MPNFETKLSAEEEKQFKAWKSLHAPYDSGEDYDLRGAFQAGAQPDPKTGHWPDTWKKPNHPTFSVESKYAKQGKPGHWEGDTFVPAESTPSKSKEVLGSKKKDEPTLRELSRMSLEHTANGHIKATHQYNEGPEEIHAVEHGGFFDHLNKAFNLSNEKKALDAKQANVAAYEKEHGSLLKPSGPSAMAPVVPDSYDKIRTDIRARASKPAAPTSELLGRADALIKGQGR